MKTLFRAGGPLFTVTLVACATTAPPVEKPPSRLMPSLVVVTATDRTTEKPANPVGELTLRVAQAAALMQNPRLAAFAWEARAREAEALQAGSAPNPEFAAEVENVGVDGVETTLSILQPIELGGKRGKRSRVAVAERDLAAWDFEIVRIEVLTEVTRSFVNVVAAQERVAIASELVDVAERVMAAVARRVRSGAVSPVEESRARVDVAMTRVELDRAERALAASRRRLAATWGSAVPAFDSVVGDLERIAERPPLDTLLARVSAMPDIGRWAAELDRRRAAAAFAGAEVTPDLGIGAGVRRFHDEGEVGFVLGLEMALPIFDTGRGAKQAARHRLAQAAHEQRASEVRAKVSLTNLYEGLLASEGESVLLRDEIVPEAERAFVTAQTAYRRGRMRLTDVLDTRRTLFELRRRYIDVLADHQETIAEIERLLGAPINQDTNDEGL